MREEPFDPLLAGTNSVALAFGEVIDVSRDDAVPAHGIPELLCEAAPLGDISLRHGQTATTHRFNGFPVEAWNIGAEPRTRLPGLVDDDGLVLGRECVPPLGGHDGRT